MIKMCFIIPLALLVRLALLCGDKYRERLCVLCGWITPPHSAYPSSDGPASAIRLRFPVTTLLLPSMTSSPHREIDEEGRLDEHYVQDAFHSYLKSSLAQARAERLLDVNMLSSAEGDLMITGTPPLAPKCSKITIHDPPIVTRTRIVPLFRCTTLNHPPTFSPSSPRPRQSQGYEPPLPHQLPPSLHPLSQTLVFLRPHDPATRTRTPTRSRPHHLRAPAPRTATASRSEPPRRGLTVHLD